MIKIVEKFDPEVMDDIVQFRMRVYTKSRRDPQHVDIWGRDLYDQDAVQIVKYEENHGILGVVRVLFANNWTVEKYYSEFNYDRECGVEFGRLAVLQKIVEGKRILFDLIYAACIYCRAQEKTLFYGFPIRRFSQALRLENIPFQVLSPEIAPYGEPCNLISFQVADLISFYQAKQAVSCKAATPTSDELEET
jgi:hypothetical protein